MTKIRILVPTNFSKQAEIAFKQSVYFSKMTGADIFLQNVITHLKKSEAYSDEIDIVQTKLQNLANPNYDLAGGKIHTRIDNGKVINQILEAYKDLKPQYLFIGTDVSSKPNSSTTIKLLNYVDCPLVVFTGRSNKAGCDKIVLPLDLTKETKQKVNKALQVAKVYNSKVYVVSATNFEDEILYNKIKAQMNQVSSFLSMNGIQSEIKLLKTKNDIEVMANAINDYADDINADLIVIMTRQEKKIQKFFVGSMAIKLIRKSTVPIMCISPKQK